MAGTCATLGGLFTGRSLAGREDPARTWQQVSTADVFDITAVCSGPSGGMIARELAGCAPVAVRDHPGAWLTWKPRASSSSLPAGILIRMGDRGLSEPPAGCQDGRAGVVEVDLRSLPPGAISPREPNQLTALADFTHGLNLGPFHWIDFEDLRQFFAVPGRVHAVSAGLGRGDHPVEAAVEAAARASVHGWGDAASAFVTVAHAPGPGGLAKGKRACNVVRGCLAPDACWGYVSSESPSLGDGQVRVTVFASRASA